MVRVISSGFSTPRSRHSSGEEMIDRFAALKAISALNELQSKQFDENSNEIRERTLVIDIETDTNDSFSGLDSEEDRREVLGATGSATNQVIPTNTLTDIFLYLGDPADFLCFSSFWRLFLNEV